jgi:hypothetical protein
MATNSMVPGSNPAGVNQTRPSAPVASVPTSIPGMGSTASPSNPYMPSGGSTPGSAPAGTPGSGTVPGSTATASSNPLITGAQDGGQNALLKQLTDIYGTGVGSELMTLLGGMGGADSATFQQYLSSMKPAEASATASLNDTMGAQGVGPNSTVSAIANSNLQSQFTAQASQFDSQLMTQQLQDTLGIVTGTQQAAAQETASSGWDVFGNVLNSLGKDASTVVAGMATGGTGLFA